MISRGGMPSASRMSPRTGRRALPHRRRTRPPVSSPASVVRSISVTARSSQPACQARLTDRRVVRVGRAVVGCRAVYAGLAHDVEIEGHSRIPQARSRCFASRLRRCRDIADHGRSLLHLPCHVANDGQGGQDNDCDPFGVRRAPPCPGGFIHGLLADGGVSLGPDTQADHRRSGHRGGDVLPRGPARAAAPRGTADGGSQSPQQPHRSAPDLSLQ